MHKRRLRRWDLFSWEKTKGRPYCCLTLPNRRAQRGWSQTLFRAAQAQDERLNVRRKFFTMGGVKSWNRRPDRL